MAGKKLLVADDSLTIQKVIRLALSNEGYEIQAVSDGNDAVQQISLFRPDVVLIDVSLPGKSAFEVKRAVNADSDLEDVRFVLMSSAFEKVDEPQVSEVVFHGRLTKPFDPAHLREVLTQVIAQIHARRTERTNPTIPTNPMLTGFTPPPIPQAPSSPASHAASHYASAPAQASVFSNPGLPDFADSEMTGATGIPGVPGAPGVSGVPGVDDASEPIAPDADIKQLTESTIRMSGLDDFEWSVQEPSLKPPPGLLNLGGGTESDPELNFPLMGSRPLHGPSEIDASSAYYQAPETFAVESHRHAAPPPIPPHAPTHPAPAQAPQAPPRMQAPIPALAPAQVKQAPIPAPAPAFSEEEVERMVARKVEEALARMARNLLPEIAEKVIKEEIHRMLSEQV